MNIHDSGIGARIAFERIQLVVTPKGLECLMDQLRWLAEKGPDSSISQPIGDMRMIEVYLVPGEDR